PPPLSPYTTLFRSTSLYPLKFVAGTGQHEQQKEINNALHARFALSHPYCFDDHYFKAAGLTQQHGLPRSGVNTSQRSARGRGPHVGVRVVGQVFHPRFIAQYTTPRSSAGGINCEHSNLFAQPSQVLAKGLYKCAFSRPRNSG